MNIRTDLAIEAHEMCGRKKAEENHLEGIDVKTYSEEGVFVTEITVKNEKGEKALGKPVGKYITVEVPDLNFQRRLTRTPASCLHGS